MEIKIGEKRIVVGYADLTKENVSGIVNSANASMLGGSGVSGAIHRAAGKDLERECIEIRETLPTKSLPTGQAIITKGYNLLTPRVIHVVGPVWKDGLQGEAEELKQVYRNSLALAEENEMKSVAFPSISTGVYRFPKLQATEIAVVEMIDFLTKSKSVDEIRVCLLFQDEYENYKNELKKYQ